MGIALSAPSYRRAEDLLRDADTAMYHAKALGKSRHQVFDSSMHARARKLLQLEHDLRRAIDRHEFHVHYQPIVRVEDRRIAGFEALVRWKHPERGMVGPSEFIHLAEETNLIVPLGRAVLEEACRQAAAWHLASGEDLFVSVNLSVKQISQPDLVEQVDGVLRLSGLPARLLKLEVTESMVMENTDGAIALLRRLKALGVQHRDRRLRDRLLVPELPAPPARGHAEDRSVLRLGDRKCRPQRQHRADGGRPRLQPGARRGGGRRRDRGAEGIAAGSRMSVGTGVPVLTRRGQRSRAGPGVGKVRHGAAGRG